MGIFENGVYTWAYALPDAKFSVHTKVISVDDSL